MVDRSLKKSSRMAVASALLTPSFSVARFM